MQIIGKERLNLPSSGNEAVLNLILIRNILILLPFIVYNMHSVKLYLQLGNRDTISEMTTMTTYDWQWTLASGY